MCFLEIGETLSENSSGHGTIVFRLRASVALHAFWICCMVLRGGKNVLGERV
jgi:hypothetical protein